MIENKPQRLTRNHKLTIKDLQTLPLPLIIKDNQIIVEMGLRNSPLKRPITLELEAVLAVKELKLIEYVFQALLCERPILLQYTFSNKSVYLWQDISYVIVQEVHNHATPISNMSTNTQHGLKAVQTK
ncbi:MAG: hypothetical protein LBE76_08010 [Nitrososphaerota archaeon]|jgi:hypothetical protein|nr:hypothetical protein [Nitrososphaerota archaeon]